MVKLLKIETLFNEKSTKNKEGPRLGCYFLPLWNSALLQA